MFFCTWPGSLWALNTFSKYHNWKSSYQSRWIVYLIGCDVIEESGLVRTKIQQPGEKDHEEIHGWDLGVLTCGKGGIEIGSAPMLWMCSSSAVTCLLLLRISVVSIQLCSTSQSWDILFNVPLCPDSSLVGVGGQSLLSLCLPRALPWKGHEMWPWQLWQRLLEAFWHFLFLNQKIPL